MKKNRKIPVIFVTGFYEEKVTEKLKELNPCEVIYKPFDHEKLLGQIQSFLK